ncbi:MAG: helix-turn-helix transcriptional regulator [Cytophagales bacterium]|nr:helix-turn-helix transcriptional regulator [Cytophagales bacterium]
MLANILNVIIWAGGVQSLVLAALLLTRRENRTANRYLVALLLTFSGQGLLIAYGNRAFDLAHPHLTRISWVLPLLLSPAFYLYVRKLTHQNPRHCPKDALHFIPAAAYGLYLLPYFLLPAAAKRAIMAAPGYGGEAYYWDELKVLQGLCYLVACFVLLRTHQRTIRQAFSDIARIRLRWLTRFLYFLVGVWAIGFGAVQFSLLPVDVGFEPVLLVYAAASVGLYAMGFTGMSQPLVFNAGALAVSNAGAPAVPPPDPPAGEPESPAKEKYTRSGLSGDQLEQYRVLLSATMTRAEPFLKNDLTIDELAQTTGIPRHHLSQVINDQFGMNFYDYVNTYRVEKAKSLLHSPRYRDQTILSLAFEAGFNSKTTFNTVFKKSTGLTPSQFANKTAAMGSVPSARTT